MSKFTIRNKELLLICALFNLTLFLHFHCSTIVSYMLLNVAKYGMVLEFFFPRKL